MNTHASDPPQNVAVLVGNGLSIAFNDNLLIPRITAEIIARLDQAGNTDDPAAQLMQEVAQRAGADNAATNFEALVGPFDEFRDGLRMIRRLAVLAGDRQLSIEKSLLESADFADVVRRHAVSHILDVIASESVAHWDDMETLQNFIISTVDSTNGGEVSFGNLNYDALLMAGLCNVYDSQMCDLTDGRLGTVGAEVVPDWAMAGRPLRTGGDLPRNRRISLIHLHGSLTWLRNTESNEYMRFGIQELRSSGYWQAWREGRTKWVPVVVLTNQNSKADLVSQYPFRLAYDLFFSRLLTADKWLIAGTSLADECVNEMLQKAWRMRSSVPQVMVVTKGNWPTADQVQKAVGYDPVWGGDPDPARWLNIHRGGIESAAESFEWMWWSGIASPIARSSQAS